MTIRRTMGARIGSVSSETTSPLIRGSFGVTNFADNDNGIVANAGQGLECRRSGQLAERNVDEDFLSAFPIGGARPTIVASTVYQGNLNDTLRINEGSARLQLTNEAPLFVDPANGNYFLAASSAALNNSTSFLNERGYLAEVQTTVGLTPTQIQAPRTDALGILRDDGFADRGALERADLVGPTAQLVNRFRQPKPIGRRDRYLLTEFTIQLQDGATITDPVFGSGIDDSSVTSGWHHAPAGRRRTGRGQDYLLNYNPVNDSLRFSPPAGVWPTNRTYTIILNNSIIVDRAANRLQANQLDGSTQFTILTGAGLDYGDAPPPYPTLLEDDGARHGLNSLYLGDGVEFDSNGSPSILTNWMMASTSLLPSLLATYCRCE